MLKIVIVRNRAVSPSPLTTQFYCIYPHHRRRKHSA